ncbi:MAG: serine protease, partial [Gammaproteobacteria bacterium]|nr:serine protease [Gammaproteobacteria bacterium]
MQVNMNDPSTQLLYSTAQVIAFTGKGYQFGTGVIVDIDRQQNKTIPILVTNKHVIENSNCITIRLHQLSNSTLSTNSIDIEYEYSNFIIGSNLDLAFVLLAPVLTMAIEQEKKPFFKSIGEDLFLNNQRKEQLSAIEEIIFIGYPRGLIDKQSKLPIVRKGITATPIWNNFNNEPEFLVDAETFEGSSGSPVFIYNNGGYFNNGGIVVGVRIMFLGIISKTLKDSENTYLGLG